MPTVSTLPLILLIALLWKLTKGHVLSIVLYTSIFEAASAVNLGQLGVATWIFALLVCLAVKMAQGHPPIRLTSGINRSAVFALGAFVLYAIWSGLVNPLLFEGVLVVRSSLPSPLHWGLNNGSQICYLLTAVLVYAIAVTSSRDDLRKALHWYSNGCVTVAVLAMYQLANAVAGVPYPRAIFYSNPSHTIYHAYQINGMWRLNGPFPEASAMASCLIVGIALLSWEMVTRPLSWRRIGSFVLELIALILTVSSTGYACLIFLIFAGLVFGALHVVHRGGLSPGKLVIGFALGSALVAAIVLTSLPAAVGKVIDSTLLEKSNSDSYKDRTSQNVAAVDTAEHTYYLGAGWGSVRASGLIYNLLGTTGAVGLTLFSVFLVTLTVPFFSRTRGRRPGGDDLFEQAMFATAMMLLGQAIAGAEPVQPMLWALFGIVSMGRPQPIAIPPRRPEAQVLRFDRQYV